MKYLWDGKPATWPGAALQAGDWVDVAYQPNLLKVKLHVYQPLTVNFLLGPNGQKTVMDANGAVELYTPGYALPVDNSGLICISPAKGAGYTDPQVGPVLIQNVKVQNCNAESQEYIVYPTGETNGWYDGSSGVSMYRAQGVTLNEVDTSGCSWGIFGTSYDYPQGVLRDITVRWGTFEGNGLVNSNRRQHSYLEGAGVLYEFCTFNALLDGAQGAAIHDRSAGLVVRYSTINAGSRLLDLANPEGGGNTLVSDPLYGVDHVYGCLLNNPGSVGPVHTGFDSNSSWARGQLRFYHNTVVNWNDQTSGYWGTTFFKLNPSAIADGQSPAANLYAVNNIFMALSPDPAHYAGDLNFGSEEYGATSAIVENNAMPGRTSPEGITTLYGWGGVIVVDDPGFVDAYNGNFRLVPSSVCRGQAWALGTDLWRPVLFQPDGTPRTSQLSLGAYEHVAAASA